MTKIPQCYLLYTKIKVNVESETLHITGATPVQTHASSVAYETKVETV
jgi:hypothetical protein